MNRDSTEIPESKLKRSSDWFKYLGAKMQRSWPFAVGIVAALIGVLFYNIFFPAPTPLSQNEIDESVVNVMASATPPPPYSAQVYQMILPSLVLIQTQSRIPGEENGVGIGSGVVINDSGDILTALHVVSDAKEIEVRFADGSQSSAIIIAAEPEIDIAVLHPNQTPGLIVPAILGNPNAMRIGDQTFAVGNPLGLTGSMSAGVISGFDRSFTIDKGDMRLEGLIQFDAAVNPGNSGGPLLNRNGQVIGIVTALANPFEQSSFSGIGFAVPITTAGGAAGTPAH
jgi:S1-C subfamily serine protease